MNGRVMSQVYRVKVMWFVYRVVVLLVQPPKKKRPICDILKH
jgi:hypothetical protein